MEGKALNDSPNARQRRRGSDEDALCARRDEALDEVVRETDVDLGRSSRRPLGTVASRVVDVRVQSVLVRHVSDPPKAGTEVAAVSPTQVAYADPRRARMLGGEVRKHAEDHVHEAVAPPPAPGAVRRAIPDRVPGKEIAPSGREPNAADEPAVRRSAERKRSAPLERLRDQRRDRRARRPHARSGRGVGWSSVNAGNDREHDGKRDVHERSTAARAVKVPVIALLALAIVTGAACRESSPADAPPGARTIAASTEPAPDVPFQPASRVRHLLGHSHLGRPIAAIQLRGFGRAPGRNPLLVVGCIHGTECAGVAVVRELLRRRQRPTTDLWLVPNANPDGFAGGHRQNARGVDLNRNFPSQWRARGVRWDPQYAGPRPRSERETRILIRLVERLRPEMTIWYHQYAGTEEFVRAWGTSVAAGRRYARLAGIPFRPLPWPNGTAPNWQNHRFRGTSSFVVEFPPGPLSRAAVERHAAAAALAVAGGPVSAS